MQLNYYYMFRKYHQMSFIFKINLLLMCMAVWVIWCMYCSLFYLISFFYLMDRYIYINTVITFYILKYILIIIIYNNKGFGLKKNFMRFNSIGSVQTKI